jgi:hypothetical protein
VNDIDLEMMINYQEVRNEMQYVHHSVAVWDASDSPRV